MADIDLDAIVARADAATGGPWKLWGMAVMADRKGTGDVDDCDDIAYTYDSDRGLRTFNAQFIAHAREDVPALVAEVRRLRETLSRVGVLAGERCERFSGQSWCPDDPGLSADASYLVDRYCDPCRLRAALDGTRQPS